MFDSDVYKRQVQFLGFNLDDRGITPSAEKVEAIQKFPKPKNRKQLQSFLGLCNYYRKFQHKYSELTAKFQPQLSAKNKWTWGEEQDITFQLIKEKFLESVIPVSYTHLDVYKRQEEYFAKHRGSRWNNNREILDESFRDITDNWWMANQSEIADYQQFRNLFKAKYWSEPLRT